ncbi:MAG: hypothetical protein H6935_12235 [Thiobacillus sp.]|nr:hypothetical protein [Thiobacillus sp.]
MAELAQDSVGMTVDCRQCGQPSTVHDTVFFVRKVLEKYFSMQASLKRAEAVTDAVEDRTKEEPQEQGRSTALEGINVYNTDLISSDLQHGPIHDWFTTKSIKIQPNHRAVDTTGFFDEVAVEIGRNYELFKMVVDQIRYAQTKNHTSVNFNLSKRAQKEAQSIAAFCRQLYDYSFASKYFYQKPEKIVRLGVQVSPQIQSFFAGEWLEWFALMQVLELSQESRARLSCTRNLTLTFSNEDAHELDVFCILNEKMPVCIECKSGEFRPLIDKYVGLRKRLGLNKAQFVICVAGLPDDQAAGLGSMYDLTFVNEQGLRAHLQSLVR